MATEIFDLDDFDAEDPETVAQKLELSAKIDALEQRCKAAKIPFERGKDEDGDHYARINLGDDRDRRPIGVVSKRKAERILDIEFEKYKYIKGYEGVCSYETAYAEIAIKPSNIHGVTSIKTLSRILGIEDSPLIIPSPEAGMDKPTISIGKCSKEFRAFSRTLIGDVFTIKFSAIKSRNMDELLEEVISYCNNILMQIDSLIGFTFLLQRERKSSIKKKISGSVADHGLIYPVTKFNHTAISLYWYAKSARDMPLLRFLAFYQAVEFYFPRYSNLEARKRVASIVKNPTFRTTNDDDLDRLVTAIRSTRGSAFGDERSQMRAVIAECVSADELRGYIDEDSNRRDHFAGKSKGHKYHKVPIENKNADLRNDVSDRLYDIRCKIVHTKNGFEDGNPQTLIPFSEEADYLEKDIDLMEFVAKMVLVASSGGIV